MQRLAPQQLWHGIRGSLAETPVPIRLALDADASIERRRALDRLAAFVAVRVCALVETVEPDDETLPLFPELAADAAQQEEMTVMPIDTIERHTTFGRWLLAQRGRADAIGALAELAARDPAFPRDGDTRAVSARLNAMGADGDIHAALDDAELDWVAL